MVVDSFSNGMIIIGMASFSTPYGYFDFIEYSNGVHIKMSPALDDYDCLIKL